MTPELTALAQNPAVVRHDLLRFADSLSVDQQRHLAHQIAAIDFDELDKLYVQSKEPVLALDPASIEPAHVVEVPRTRADEEAASEASQRGLDEIKAGRVAAVLVAGGQGSRLGFEHPKGMFPVGPVRGTSLFQIFAETLCRWSANTGIAIPWLIMTSPTNRDETIAFFESNNYFGFPKSEVRFFVQGTMPAVDRETGKVLLAGKGELFTSPNGHGGTLLALRDSGLLGELAARGIETLYYFQVDNPFAKILDPEFLGHHLLQNAEMSVKVVRKRHAAERVGLVVQHEGKASIVEYSDLPTELGEQTNADGSLRYWPGNTAIHVFDRRFIERITSKELHLPFHFANKAVPYVDASGTPVQPEKPNAVKFEMFIFDAMPLASRVAVVETLREEEFMPVKNATGDDSPATAQAAMIRRAGQWLRRAEIAFPIDANDMPQIEVEISPLLGLTGTEFAAGITDRSPVKEATYFGPDGRG